MMPPNAFGSAELYALAHDLVTVVQHHQQMSNANITLQMHSTRMEEWDEICVMAVDAVTSKEKIVIKISLAQLTPAERTELQLQISLHNKTLISPDVFNHKNNSLLIH